MIKPGLCVLMAVGTLTACKGKGDKRADNTTGSAAGSATGSATGSAPTEPGSAATPPPADAVKLASGEPKLGCLGWSPTTKTAACVIGESGSMQDTPIFQVRYLGSTEPSTELAIKRTDTGDAIEEASVTAANATLAKLGIQPFAEPAKEIKTASTTDLGKGASIVWTSKMTDEGGDNMPPTHKHTIVAKCGSTSVELEASEAEGVNPTFKIWSLGDQALIDVASNTAREGEYGEERTAFLLDLATCKVEAGRHDPR